MRNEMFYYPSLKWYESESNVLTIEQLTISNKELEQLYQEGQEYDFLKGKTPKVLPDYWEEED